MNLLFYALATYADRDRYENLDAPRTAKRYRLALVAAFALIVALV